MTPTEALLRTAVEWDRFHACRSALARAPTHGAMQRRALNSARATDLFEAHNPVRVGSGVLGVLLSRAAASVSAAQVAADELPVALRNLVPDLWIRQSIEERRLPLKHMELRRYNRRRHRRD